VNIVDRRRNMGGKSLPNRSRFLHREQAAVRKAVADAVASRRVSDIGKEGTQVTVDSTNTSEPSLRSQGGSRDLVLPGNREYVPGDQIKRPVPRGGGSGAGTSGGTGEGKDSFQFDLSAQEFLDVFFGELELPDMIKVSMLDEGVTRPARAGFTISGTPSSLSVGRTMIRSTARRVGLGASKDDTVARLQEELEQAIEERDGDAVSRIREEIEDSMRRFKSSVPWIDPIDLRYNRFERRPLPIASAVMFCLMDVSGSMDEMRKRLAKNFFTLLYLFLRRRYEKVTVVFIRHTEIAEEVDEETFFHDPKNGGTLVSSGLRKVKEVQAARFPSDINNIYVAQASDGDNLSTDRAAVAEAMAELLPLVQYFAYIETGGDFSGGTITDLWRSYNALGSDGAAKRLAMRRVAKLSEIWPVFAELFAKKSTALAA
jgi:uncharacterized sporulation protein YeaH/YhbH (DUF444 family)